MKRKLFTLLLLAAVGISLFVSCSAAPEAVEPDSDAIAYVRFGEEAGVRSFSAEYNIQDYDNLYWFYTATKADGYGKTGETAAEVAVTKDTDETTPAKGLSGTIGPFSQGNWTFTLKAYAAVDSTTKKGQNLVYENDAAVSVTLRGGETKSISVTVKAVGETGLLSFRDLSGITEANKAFFKWADGADTSSKPYFTIEATKTTDNTLYILTTDSSVTGNNVLNIVLGDYDSTAKGYPIQYFKTENGSNVSADISLPVGYYSCRIYAYRAGETAEKNLIAIDKSFAFRIYGGATTVVTGDLTENPNSTVTFDVPEVAIVQVVPDKTQNTTKVEASVAPQKSTETGVTAKTEVSIPTEVLDTTGSTSYSLEVSALSENTASNSFTVSAEGSTGEAKIYGSISLSLNAVKDNTSTAVKTFSSPVTVSVFVGKGLSDVTIKYVNDDGTEADADLQPDVTSTGLGYDSETGMFTFTTKHFSTFVVASTRSAVVKNVSNGKLYNSLAEAIKELGDTSELKLIADISDEDSETTAVSLGDKEVSLVIDLDGKEVKNISLEAGNGSITLKNGTVTDATVKSGSVTFLSVNSEDVSLDKDYDGVITFEDGTLEAGSGEAAFNVAENTMTAGKAPTYIFRNVKVTAGSKRGIKVAYAKSITVHNCTFDGSSLSSEGSQPEYITRSLSALDIAVYTPDVDISIIGNTFNKIPGASGNVDTDTAAAIKIKSGNGGEGKVGSIGNVVIRDNTFTECVRDVTIGKADTATTDFRSQTKSAIDSEGNILSGWTISGNTSDNEAKEDLAGILVYTDASNVKTSAKIGQIVGGCSVYDISTADEAKVGDKRYLTLEEAVTNAPEGSTITLLRDVDLTNYTQKSQTETGYTFTFAKDITLDMNSKTITSNNFGVVYEGDGLTIKNGTFKVKDSAKDDGIGSYAIFFGLNSGDSTIEGYIATLDNVTCEGGINVSSHQVVVKNSTINGTHYYALWAENKGQITVESGNFTSQCKVSGTSVLHNETNGKIIIKGGTFTAPENKLLFHDKIGSCEIYGGTFNADPGAYVADGYFAKKESDAEWTVISKDEIVSGVTISGIAGYEHTLFATANDAYDTITKVLEEKGGLGQEQTLSVDGFDALFTDTNDSGEANVIWTIYGKQTIVETTDRSCFMSFGRKASRYCDGKRYFSKFMFIGGNENAKLICSSLTFPYEWWSAENPKSEVSFKNLTFESSNGEFLEFKLGQGFNYGLIASFVKCTFTNGRIYLYNNATTKYNLTECSFDGKGKSESAIHIQGSNTEVTEITIKGCEFKNSRGIDVCQATAEAVIEENTFINCGNQTNDEANNHHSAIKITRGNKVIINKNAIKDCKGTAIYVRGNGASDPFKGTLTITDNTISNCTYAFCDYENGEHSLYTLVTSGNTITDTETTKCSYDGVEKDIEAYLK